MSIVKSAFADRSEPILGGIELRHLRYALLAAELRSFAKAAARCRIKQATLSRHVSYLEQCFGAPLFHRSPRGVTPTAVGDVFLTSARRVLDEMSGLYEKTRAVSRGDAGTLAIGFITSITAGNLRSSLFAFQDENPCIGIRGVEGPRSRLKVKLETGGIDVLIVSGTVNLAGIRQMDLWSERVFAALPSDHPLASRAQIYWSDLAGEAFLAPINTADDVKSIVQGQLTQVGTDLPIVVADVSRETVLGAVGAGRAITIISAGSAGMKMENVTLKPVFGTTGPHLLSFSAYWREDNGNPTLERFLTFLRARYSLPALPD